MPKKATTKRTLVDKVREGGFTFHVYDNGETDVYKGTTRLGTIIRSQEKSGRHCFRLKEDRRRSGRQYRGRKKAAEARPCERERMVVKAIERYEPRIVPGSLDVKLSTTADGVHSRILFNIHAEIWAQPVPVEVFMRTELDLASGDMSVVKG